MGTTKENKSAEQLFAENLSIFNEKLEKSSENIKTKYHEKLKNLAKDSSKTEEFYELFAEFVEESNFVKMLYQILLEEYFRLGIFSPDDYKSLKRSAVEKIKQRIEMGDWFGIEKSQKRADFRFEMLALIRTKVHQKSVEKAKDGKRIAAICFSGGGIRSATFGLGILQGLAKHGLLKNFDYISTVSGGGYIGSWLSAWMYRIQAKNIETSEQNNDEAKVEAKEKTNSTATLPTADVFSNKKSEWVENELNDHKAQSPEPPQVTHLRSYSNYMSPRPGLFSADTWTLIAVYLRNLLLNWTVFVPLIAAILLLPKIYVTVLSLDYYGVLQYVLLGIAIFFGVGGVMNINAMRPSLKAYSWVDQTFKEDDIGIIKSVEAKVFRWVLLWILILAFSLTTFWAWNNGSYCQPLADLLGIGNASLIKFILFSEVLFLGGYILAWVFMFLGFGNENDKNLTFGEKVKRFSRTFPAEFCVSIACGVFSGALLFLVVKNLPDLSRLVDKIKIGENQSTVSPEFLACFGVPLFLFAFLLAATLFVGFAVRITDDEDREWMARLGAWILMVIIGWSVISTAVIYGPSIFSLALEGKLFASIGGLSGLVTLILGFSNKSSAKNDEQPKSNKSFLLWFAPAVAAPIFVLFLVVLISYITDALTANVVIFASYKHLTWFVILAFIGSVMGFFININKFSFHSIYRERLIRAYLGASRTKERLYTANSFTGLDSENDNLEMSCLKQKPFHVVNMTLNLVKTHNLRWQNRKAESFTATALYCGSSNMGDGSGNYRSSENYGLNVQNGRAMTLGTAAAISGAAASPNMGYYTMSSAVSFLMVLFNVRLGWWLGNPGRRGEDTYNLPAPRWSPRLFLDESIGGTDDSKPYVYLSDGGHFDNLGLYEMVLRRCQLIVVSDAGCDGDFGFSDFGTSIHKIRVDMGIPIEFEKENHPIKTHNCGIGKIKYSSVDENAEDGVLIYIKPTLDGDEPIDLKNYKTENPEFPHESTADQMYSETQFESYRSLGVHQINSICCRQTPCSCGELLSNLETNARNYLKSLPK